MADITMCSGKDCPLKLECKRYLATPSLWGQSYIDPPFVPGPPVSCVEFWPWKDDANPEGEKRAQRAAAAKRVGGRVS
jgi:hypothetical protein